MHGRYILDLHVTFLWTTCSYGGCLSHWRCAPLHFFCIEIVRETMWMLRSTTAGPIVVVYVLVVVSPGNFLLNAWKHFHIDPFEPLHSPMRLLYRRLYNTCCITWDLIGHSIWRTCSSLIFGHHHADGDITVLKIAKVYDSCTAYETVIIICCTYIPKQSTLVYSSNGGPLLLCTCWPLSKSSHRKTRGGRNQNSNTESILGSTARPWYPSTLNLNPTSNALRP
jgi:hypothetical protein